MQQTRHRAALQGSPVRIPMGLRSGSPYAPPMPRMVPSPPSSYASRVQPTAYLLGRQVLNRPAPPPVFNWGKAATEGVALAGMQRGLSALGADWLAQGLMLALGSEVITKMLDSRTPGERAEDVQKVYETAQELSNPFSNAGVAGPDQVIELGLAGRGRGWRGMGNAAAAHGLSTATAISSAAIQSGSSLASSSTWLAAAGGPIGLAVAGTTVALTYLFTRQRPARKIATTEIVNEVEPLLQQNLQAYMSGPRSPESQQQAIANFQAAWSYVQQYCGDPNMGKPGEWCISDRKRGGKWDWFARYLDPIANDTKPQEQPSQTMQVQLGDGSVVTTTAGNAAAMANAGGGGINPLLLLGGLVVLGVMVSG